MVQLEVGKYYKTRDGRKVGPMRRRDWLIKHPFICEIIPTPECSVYTAIWERDGKNYELRNLDIVSEWGNYSSCKAAQVDVQREEYGPAPVDPWHASTHYTAGPVRTVTETKTRREIVPGTYGIVRVDNGSPFLQIVEVKYNTHSAEELREAAHLFNQLAEVLDDNRA